MRDYTNYDEKTIISMAGQFYGVSEIAERLGRTCTAISQKMYELGVSVRMPKYTPMQCGRIIVCCDNEFLAIEMGRTRSMIVSKRSKLKTNLVGSK